MFLEGAQKKLFVAVWNSLLVNVWTSLCWIPSWQKFWRQIEATKVTLLCKYAHFSQTLPWHYADNSGDTSFFLSHLVSNVSPLTWTCQFENSSALLWNPRYSEKDELPEPFASSFWGGRGGRKKARGRGRWVGRWGIPEFGRSIIGKNWSTIKYYCDYYPLLT